MNDINCLSSLMTHVVYQVLKLLVLTHSTMGKTATQQANKNAITLRGSAEIVAEFFSEWISNLHVSGCVVARRDFQCLLSKSL